MDLLALLPVVSLYAGLLGLGFVWLSVLVIRGRMHHGLVMGDGGVDEMQHRIRAHANFAEYVPIGIVLMLVAEIQLSPVWLLHVIGLTLLAGRAMHGYSLVVHEMRTLKSGNREIKFRQWGMVLTFASVGLASVTVLFF